MKPATRLQHSSKSSASGVPGTHFSTSSAEQHPLKRCVSSYAAFSCRLGQPHCPSPRSLNALSPLSHSAPGHPSVCLNDDCHSRDVATKPIFKGQVKTEYEPLSTGLLRLNSYGVPTFFETTSTQVASDTHSSISGVSAPGSRPPNDVRMTQGFSVCLPPAPQLCSSPPNSHVSSWITQTPYGNAAKSMENTPGLWNTESYSANPGSRKKGDPDFDDALNDQILSFGSRIVRKIEGVKASQKRSYSHRQRSAISLFSTLRNFFHYIAQLEAQDNPCKYTYDSRVTPEQPVPSFPVRLLHITELPFLILWVYATYWIVIVAMTFQRGSATVWLSATIAGLLVGLGLNANAYKHLTISKHEAQQIQTASTSIDWGMVARFFLIPFGVSSLSGLTHSAREDFLLVFPRRTLRLAIAFLCPAAVIVCLLVIRLILLWRLRVRWSFYVFFFNGTLVQ